MARTILLQKNNALRLDARADPGGLAVLCRRPWRLGGALPQHRSSGRKWMALVLPTHPSDQSACGTCVKRAGPGEACGRCEIGLNCENSKRVAAPPPQAPKPKLAEGAACAVEGDSECDFGLGCGDGKGDVVTSGSGTCAPRSSSARDRSSPYPSAGSKVERIVGTYYAACMDETAVEARGRKPLESDLALIASITTRADLVRAIAMLSRRGIDTVIDLSAEEDAGDATHAIAGVDRRSLTLRVGDNNSRRAKRRRRSARLRGPSDPHLRAARSGVDRGMPRLLLNFALARRLGSLYATFFVSASADAASGRSALTSAFI